MTDLDLLTFGCIVSFVAVAGIYVLFRSRYEEEMREEARVEAARARPEASRVP